MGFLRMDSDHETSVLNEKILMVFDMKGQSEASFLYDVKILISSPSHPLPGISGTDSRTETLIAGRDAAGLTRAEVLFLLFKCYADF